MYLLLYLFMAVSPISAKELEYGKCSYVSVPFLSIKFTVFLKQFTQYRCIWIKSKIFVEWVHDYPIWLLQG